MCIMMPFFILPFSAVFENITELRPEVCKDLAKQGLLQWLMRRLRVKTPFDNNKLYASEILSILLQNTPENRQLLGDMDGIDTILQQLAVSHKYCIHHVLNYTRLKGQALYL